MNFANMNPADRMKASGLIGLIVVIMFFVVHTMLGIVAPKKPAVPAQDGGAPSPTAPGPPVPATGPAAQASAPADGAKTDFPLGRVVASQSSISKALQVDPGNPFVQIEHPKKGSGAARPTDNNVDLHPIPAGPAAGFQSSFPTERGPVAGLPGLGPSLASGSLAPAAIAIQTPAQPEIKVVGIVHGDQSVATMQVGARVLIARPGDALYPGWRMTGVTGEGVRIRHEGKTELVRVGAVLNDKAEKPDAKQ